MSFKKRFLEYGRRKTESDPGFRTGGANFKGGGGGGCGGGDKVFIRPNFPENCMKLKKIGPGRASKILLCRSATGINTFRLLLFHYSLFPVIEVSFFLQGRLLFPSLVLVYTCAAFQPVIFVWPPSFS